jgi:foldase protein PrsA
MRAARATAAVAAMLCAVGFTACGGTPDSTVVVRVGDVAFTKAAVDHWTSVVERGGPLGGFRGKPLHGTARQRAVALLISSEWLTGAARLQGVPVAEAAVDEVLVEREQSAEFKSRLRTLGQTLADVRRELRAEIAGEALRAELAGEAHQFTQHDVAEYFRSHRDQFRTAEIRVTDLVENLPSAPAARALVRRVGAGRRFTAMAFHEQVTHTAGFMASPEKAAVVNAIFAARPGVVSQPMLINHNWTVFVVRRIIPPRYEPLARVRDAAASQFDIMRQHEVARRFDREYRQRWGARTRCRAGYVAPGCPQFAGQLGAYEEPFSLRAHPLLSENTSAG